MLTSITLPTAIKTIKKLNILMNQGEFEQRRHWLMQQIGDGNIAVIASASRKIRNKDVHFPFRQESDFYYLTGFPEDQAVAVFIPGREQGEYIIFCREFDPEKALWEGAHAGLEGAIDTFAADDAFAIDHLDAILPGMLENKDVVYYPMGRDRDLDHRLLEWTNEIRNQSRTGVSAPVEFISLEHLLHEMRLLKSPAEIQLMRDAAEVSAKAHIRAMKACKNCTSEMQIEAELLHEFISHGLRNTAYPSIVAGGHNACVLHYTENNARLRQGDLLLIDAGVECDYYAADITRTFPVSGRFSQPQKQLYQLVLDAQLAAIEQIRPGIPWDHVHETAIEVLTAGLVDLGILAGDITELIANQTYKQFYMHRIGHWLGMDVHDVGEYKIEGEWRLLEPSMVLTIEPGLYIPVDCQTVDQQWRGIGIRIEDDLLVTEDGYEVLSAGVPKSVAEIEALMQA